MVLKPERLGNEIRNILKVLKVWCRRRKERSIGRNVWKIKMYYLEARKKETAYTQ